MAMDKLVAENDDHFLVHDGGSHVMVAKHGLSGALLRKIRSLPQHEDAQHFADGTADVEPLDPEPVGPAEVDAMRQRAQFGAMADPNVPATEEEAMATPEIGAPPITETRINRGLTPNPNHLWVVPGTAPPHTMPQAPGSVIPRGGEWLAEAAANPVAALAGSPGPLEASPGEGAQDVPPLAPKAAPAAVAPAAQPVPSSASVSMRSRTPGAGGGGALPPVAADDSVARIDADTKRYEQAQMRLASLAQKHASAQVDIMAQREQTLAASKADYDQRIAANQKHQDELIRGGNPTGVNPSQWWESRSTGQRVSAYVSMIFGGIAQGFGGQNIGSQIIKGAIADDLRAQEGDLENKRADKRGLLAHYVAEGNTLDHAKDKAMADALDSAARQIAMTSVKFGGLAANPQAAADAAKFSMEADEKRAKVAKESVEAAWTPRLNAVHVALMNSEAAKNYAQMDEFRAAASVKGADKGPNPGMTVTLLGPHGSTEDGEQRVAKSQQDKEAFDKARTAAAELMALTEQARKFQQDHGRTWKGSDADAEGTRLRQAIILSAAHLGGNTIRQFDIDAFHDQTEHPGSWWQGRVTQSLDHLDELARNKVAAEANARTFGAPVKEGYSKRGAK